MVWPPACSRPPRRKPQLAKALYDVADVGVGCEWQVAVLLVVSVGGLGPTLTRKSRAADAAALPRDLSCRSIAATAPACTAIPSLT